MNIVVLFGGTSPEREISLKSGENIAATLRARGHQVETLDTAVPNFVEQLLQLNQIVFFQLYMVPMVRTARFKAC